MTEVELFQRIRAELYTPVVGDVLDAMGYRHQLLAPGIRAIAPGMTIVGRAMPALSSAVFGPQEKPFGKLTEALDNLKPGDVYVGHGAGVECAAWGEILTATARVRGAVGAVIHGYHRDTPQVLAQNWPVFSHGAYAQDSAVRSIILDYGIPIEIDGVSVMPGDLVFADIDGVLVVPREVETEALERAFVKAATENRVRAAIEAGMSSTEAFSTFGVL